MRLPMMLFALAIGAAPAASAGPSQPAPRTATAPAPTGGMPIFKGPSAMDAKDCPPTSRYHAVKKNDKQRPEARKLVELPMADMYASVYRRIGPCEAPVIVRYGIGGGQR